MNKAYVIRIVYGLRARHATLNSSSCRGVLNAKPWICGAFYTEHGNIYTEYLIQSGRTVDLCMKKWGQTTLLVPLKNWGVG